MANIIVSTAYSKPLNLSVDSSGAKSLDCRITIPKDINGITFYVDALIAGESYYIISKQYELYRIAGVDSGDLTMSFTLDIEIPEEVAAEFEYFKQRHSGLYISYEVDGHPEDSGVILIPNVQLLNHVYNPAIQVFGLERGTNGQINDEGENLLTTLKIDYSDGDMSYMPLRLHYAQGVSVDETAPYIDLSGDVERYRTGVVDDPDAIQTLFSNGHYWAFLLVFGDNYEKKTAAATISRAFANLHLSGWPTGGACFGGFGKSQNNMPLLESYYRFYPYAGIDGVNIYKSTEVRTGGLWSDNKPIYRKVLEVPEIPANRTSTNVLIMIDANMETLIEMRGMLRRGSNAWWPLTYRSMSNYTSLALDVWSKEGGIAIRTGSNTEISGGYIVVDYTKTTDEAEDDYVSYEQLMDAEGYALRDSSNYALLAATDDSEQKILKFAAAEIDQALEMAMSALQKSGGIMTGALQLADDPTADLHAATKRYVDKVLPAVTEVDDGKILTVSGGAWTAAELPRYDGEYSVTPAAEEQTLLTARKYLDANLKIEKIPYSEVSNTANGTTVTIG